MQAPANATLTWNDILPDADVAAVLQVAAHWHTWSYTRQTVEISSLVLWFRDRHPDWHVTHDDIIATMHHPGIQQAARKYRTEGARQ